MARRVFDGFSTELHIRLGKRTDFTSEMREQHLNDALRKVANHYVHPQLEGKTTGVLNGGTDNFSPVASDLWWPDTVKDATIPRVLKPGDKEVIEAIVKPSSNPARFYWWGSVFYVDAKPTSNHNMEVWYVKEPAYWTFGESMLDAVFDPLILKWAAKLAFETFRDFEEAKTIGIEISMYQAQMRLPVRQQRFNDHNTGLKVRLR